MATSVSKMTPDERKGLIDKLSDCVKKHQLESELQVTTYRETVCALAAKEVEDTFKIKIDKKMKPEQKAQVEAFKADANEIVKGIEGTVVNVNCVIGVGSQYDPISDIVPIKGGDPITLNHVPGEVWLIDFWATWCPPCQKPMAHNEEMLTRRGAEWGDKVKIIGISIDQTADAVVKHIDSMDWNRPIHYHRAKSNCSQVYEVNGVPHVMLIDTNGKIVYKGHPAGRPNLEEDFDILLKGDEIKGVEAEGGAGQSEEAGAAGGADKDPAACLGYIDKFASDIAPGLQKNEEIAALAKNMQRAFCVMVYEEKFNVETGKNSIDWKNYRVLVGPGDSVDKAKGIMDEQLDANAGFEIVLREHKL